MKKTLFFASCTFAIVLLAVVAQAQPVPPNNPNSVPIDGGLSLLLAAGAGLGLKKAWDKYKQ